jgi:tetratricopeptide (TPR) repeat protein
MTFLPVGSISYRTEMILAIFTLSTVYFHAKARVTGSNSFHLLASVCFVLALFAKETALFVVPSLIILWELTKTKKDNYKVRKIFIYYLGLIIIYSTLRFLAVPEIWRTPQPNLNFSKHLGTRLSTSGKLFLEMLIPFKPPLTDSVKIVSLLSIQTLAFLPATLLSLIYVLKNKLDNDFSKAILIFLILLLPSLNFIPTPRFGSPHYGYIALPGLCIVFILLIKRLEKKLSKNILYTLVFLWLLSSSLSTFLAGFNFKNDLTLFRNEVSYDANFLEGWYYLGNYYLISQDFSEASDSYTKVLKNPKGYLAYSEQYSTLLNLSASEIRRGHYEVAKTYLLKAQKLAPEYEIPNIRYNLSVVATKEKDYKKVVGLITKDYEFWQTPQPFIILANAYHFLGDSEKSLSALKKALSFSEGDLKTRIELLIKEQSVENSLNKPEQTNSSN